MNRGVLHQAQHAPGARLVAELLDGDVQVPFAPNDGSGAIYRRVRRSVELTRATVTLSVGIIPSRRSAWHREPGALGPTLGDQLLGRAATLGAPLEAAGQDPVLG